MYTIKVIIASTRPGRKGPAIASWIFEKAKTLNNVNLELLDLAEINLPFMDEPAHPRLRTYQHDHTKKWSATIDAADAFIIVTPEYNFGFSAPLKNAFDYLLQEWQHKPVAIVSYGGIAAGTRSAQMLKQVITALSMMPISEAVNIPFFTKHIDEDGNFISDETLDKSADTMLKELLRWTKGLKAIREDKN